MEEILKNADIYFTIDFIATRMEIILNDNKLKFPTKDFKEQENIIKMMRKVELSYLELAEFRRQINKVLKEVYNKNSILEISKCWITTDIRPGRENEEWLNCLLKKRG